MNLALLEEIKNQLTSRRFPAREVHKWWDQYSRLFLQAEDRDSVPFGAPQRLEAARLIAARALECGEFLLVCDAARAALARTPGTGTEFAENEVLLRMHWAYALQRLDELPEARHALQPVLAEPCLAKMPDRLRSEIYVALGQVARETSQRGMTHAAREASLLEACDFFDLALKAEPQRLDAALELALVSLLLGDQERARHLARTVVESSDGARPEVRDNFDPLYARALALGVMGKTDEAAEAFGALAKCEDGDIDRLAEARYVTQFLAEALGQPRDLFYKAFPPLRLIVFAGHIPDRPGARKRFPAEAAEEVKRAIQLSLARLEARAGLSSAAAGADLLFVQAMLQRAASVHLVLPWSSEEFKRTSVLPFDEQQTSKQENWSSRFDEALANAASVHELGQFHMPQDDSGVGWRYLVEVAAGMALQLAKTLRLDLHPLAFWDRLPGFGDGGTEAFVRFWKHHLKIEPELIDYAQHGGIEWLQEDPRPAERAEKEIIHQEVKSMLFADVVGYSKLTEQAIPEFARSFLRRIADLAKASDYGPKCVNTWGDAIYAVFDFTRDAAIFALELVNMIASEQAQWLAKGLYSEEVTASGKIKKPLSVRVGLHTGPVFLIYDPVVCRLSFTGSHVSRAARIEPVTSVSQVYASEEFAALLELDTALRQQDAVGRLPSKSVCHYAGTMPLAKNYPGRFRIYRVLPRIDLRIEELARAAHEFYCEAARKRGDSPETNSALRPWEELPESLRDANRAQVADIPNQLQLLGYELTLGPGMPPHAIQYEGRLEELATREHHRWMDNRKRDGWTYAPQRDDARKHHPLLVPWDHLIETDKEKDRDIIRHLPALVEKSGFRVVHNLPNNQ